MKEATLTKEERKEYVSAYNQIEAFIPVYFDKMVDDYHYRIFLFDLKTAKQYSLLKKNFEKRIL